MTDSSVRIRLCAHCGEEIPPGVDDHVETHCENVVWINGHPFAADKVEACEDQSRQSTLKTLEGSR